MTTTVKLSECRIAIPANEPFKMFHHSIVLPDGSVAYTDHKSLESYSEEQGKPYKIITDAEFYALIEEAENALKTAPKLIDKESFWEALECLPPCKWRTVKGVELFHVSERLTGELVSWYAQIEDTYYAFTDDSRKNMNDLATLVIIHHNAAKKGGK